MLYCENYRLRWQSTSNNYNTISTNDQILTMVIGTIAMTFEDQVYGGSPAVNARLCQRSAHGSQRPLRLGR